MYVHIQQPMIPMPSCVLVNNKQRKCGTFCSYTSIVLRLPILYLNTLPVTIGFYDSVNINIPIENITVVL